jgi:hypothetical protein
MNPVVGHELEGFIFLRDPDPYTVAMLPWFCALVALLVAGQSLDVRGASDCPSTAAVSVKLGPLLAQGAGEGPGEGDVAWLEQTMSPEGQATLHLRLVRSDATVVGDRQLVLQGTCDERADTVAAVLASWEAPPTTPLVPTVASAQSASPSTPTTTQLWLGAAGGAGLVGGLAATAGIELLAHRPDSRGQVRVEVLTQTSRRRTLDVGDVSWRRTYGSLGLGWHTHGGLSRPFWRASAEADLLLGWLSAAGNGFAPNRRQDALEYGVGVVLRAERRMGAWGLWLAARTNLWGREERAVLSGSPSATVLPRFEAVALFGVSRLVLR